MALDVESELKDGKWVENIPQVSEPKMENILGYVYAIMGLVAVVVIVYSSILYLTSAGDAAKAKKATQGIIYAAIGLGIVMLAAVITTLVFTTVRNAG